MNPIEYLWNSFSTTAQERIDLFIEEYTKFLPYAEKLGLKVDSLTIEAGALPEIQTSLRGSLENITNEKVERIKSENSNPLFLAFLDAILLAKDFNDKLKDIYISPVKEIVIDITFGIVPHVSIRFQF